jgi:glycosyltransferase involved in cell wall biosynthesis
VILFVTGEYPPDIGGVGDYTASLRSALGSCGWSSEVVTRRQVPRWDSRALGWFVRHAPPRGVVHIQFQAGAFDLLGDVCLLPMLLHRVRPHVRTVTTFHDTRVPYLFPRAGRLRALAVQLLARSSDVVIAADAHDVQTLGGPSPRHVQVPIGSNVPCSPPGRYDRLAFRRQLGLEEDDLAIVYFGLLNASKGLDLLLGTFERLRSVRLQTQLLLLGGEVGASDPTDRLTASSVADRIARLGKDVLRPGWLPSENLSAHLLAGDVALLPYTDGASARRGSLLACAAHGLPIVSTLPAADEVEPYVAAVAASTDDLSAAVLRVAADRERWQAASRLLAEQVSWPRIAARHVEVYQRLLYSASR